MTRDSIFDRYFASEGGRADLAGHPLEDMFNERRRTYRKFLIDRLKQLAKVGTNVDVHFDFVENPDINAGAGKADSQYLIGVNVGIFETLLMLPRALLSWPEIFPQIGNAAEEVAGPFDFAGSVGLPWEPRSARVRKGAPRLLTPRDAQRNSAALSISLMAMDFVVTHEFGHIMAGHLDYLAHIGQPLRLEEAGGIASVDTSLLQALEIQADLDGSSMIASAVLHRLVIGRDFAHHLDQQTFLVLWVFTLLLLFHLFDLANPPGQDLSDRPHPHPEYRLEYTLSALLAVAREIQPEMEPIIETARKHGIAEFDTAWTLLGLGDSVLHQQRRNTVAFAREGKRLADKYMKTIEPVRQFAETLKLGMTFGRFGIPVNAKRPESTRRKGRIDRV